MTQTPLFCYNSLLSGNKKGLFYNVKQALLKSFNSLAILLKRTYQVIGNHLRRAAFNLVALNNVHQFTIFKQSH